MPPPAAAPPPPPPALLDVAARLPEAAALILQPLSLEDRKALRRVHSLLDRAVRGAAAMLEVRIPAGGGAAPVPARWPAVRKLKVALDGWGEEPAELAWGAWPRLEALTVAVKGDFFLPAARAVAAAAPLMPALRTLVLGCSGRLSHNALLHALGAFSWPGMEEPLWPTLEELRIMGWCHTRGDGLPLPAMWRGAPRLRRLSACGFRTSFAPPALAACGWALEELDLSGGAHVRDADVAALAASGAFALRRLDLSGCPLTAAALASLAAAPWPLEELRFGLADFRGPAAGPALAALSRHAGLRHLSFHLCQVDNDAFIALASATWPALTYLNGGASTRSFAVGDVQGPEVFAGFPALQELFMGFRALGEAGARTLAGRPWPCLTDLTLNCQLEPDATVAALARGAWPALARLRLIGWDVRGGAALTLRAARRWAPALAELECVSLRGLL